MIDQEYEKLTVLQLREVAKAKNVRLGAGISKQGIVDKLHAADAAAAAMGAPLENTVVESSVAPRHAAIITDEEEVEDDLDGKASHGTYSAAPQPQMTVQRPSAPVASSSPLSTVSSKAPAFNMEDSITWHNPRPYRQSSAPARSMQNQNWNNGSRMNQGAADGNSYNRGMSNRGADNRMYRSVNSNAYSNQRFGPQQNDMQPAQSSFYQQPGFVGDYTQPDNAYAPQMDYQQQNAPYNRSAPMQRMPEPEQMMTGECGEGEGLLELHPDGYGFLRSGNLMPNKTDIYVNNAQVRRYGLRTGDWVSGKTQPRRDGDRNNPTLLYITSVNHDIPVENPVRPIFDDLTALYPKRRINLAVRGAQDPMMRSIELLCPMGFGQRALVTAPPRSGRTTLMKKLSNAIVNCNGKVRFMTLLLDERPEEITELRESLSGEVIGVSIEQPAEALIRTAEMTLERAKRMVEQKQDVVLMVDDLNSLAKAYMQMAPANARLLPNGMIMGCMTKVRRFLAAARNTREGGTLTIIALEQVDTGVGLDDAVREEMRDLSNLDLSLIRVPQEKVILPAFDLIASNNRREELIMTPQEKNMAGKLRQMMTDMTPAECLALLHGWLEKTKSNAELLSQLDEVKDTAERS